MRTSKARRVAALSLALGLTAMGLTACETAPATGKRIFTGGLSPQAEAQLGLREHDKVLAEFGGAYDDPALAAYVSSLGNLLVQTSETPNERFTFTVLDSPVVNAFALPGGYVYVTRGLMALADNEAELAGVMAHEIGHVTARHPAERYGDQMTASILSAGAAVLLGGGAGQSAGAVSQLVLSGYSRDQEYEADLLGVRYLSRSGHDPRAMASFLAKLQAQSRLEADLAGQPGRADEFSLLQSHPRTADRVQRAIAEASGTAVADPIVARDIYLRKIDGLLYGDNPNQGLIRGREFVHPDLGFAFQVPDDFRLFNSTTRVTARGPRGAAIVFDQARQPSRASMTDYLVREWARSLSLTAVEPITVNGMEAASGAGQVNTRSGALDLRLVAIRYDAERIYRFAFITAPQVTARHTAGFRRTTYSFRRLGQADAGQYGPQRVRLYTVRPGDTPSSIASRMPFEERKLDRFLVLNGLDRSSGLQAGQTVKIIAQ